MVRLLKGAGFEYVHSVVSRVMSNSSTIDFTTTTTAASCASTSRTLHMCNRAPSHICAFTCGCVLLCISHEITFARVILT